MQQKTMNKASIMAYLPALWALALLGLAALLPPSVFYLGLTTLYLLPVMVVLAVYTSGAAGGALIIISASLLNLSAFDARALPATLGYLLPLYGVTLYISAKKPPFFHAVMQTALAYAATVTLLFLALQWAAGGELGSRLTSLLVRRLNALPFRDDLLYALSGAGFISLGAKEAGVPVFIESATEIIFTDAARSELFAQIAARASILMRSLFPSLLTQVALLHLPLSLALAQYLANKYRPSFSSRFPLPDMPPFSKWYIPAGYAGYLWPMAGFYLLSLVAKGALAAPGGMVYAVFVSIFSIQGAAVLSALSRRLTRRFYPRLILMALILMLAPMTLYLMGLMDQFIDIRSLRRKKAQNNTFTL